MFNWPQKHTDKGDCYWGAVILGVLLLLLIPIVYLVVCWCCL
jgi:hypothetical protein